MKRRLSDIALLSSLLAVSHTSTGLCQGVSNTSSVQNKNNKLPSSINRVNTGAATSAAAAGVSAPATSISGAGLNTQNTGVTNQTNLPGGNLSTQPVFGGAGSQEKLDIGKSNLGNTSVNQINQQLNQIESVSQQRIQDGNPVGNDIGTAATFTERVDGSTEYREEGQSSSTAVIQSNGKSSSITLEEVRAQEEAEANRPGGSLEGMGALLDLAGRAAEQEAAAANSKNSGDSQSQQSGDGSSGGTTGTQVDGDKKPDNGERLGIFQDPTKGGGGPGVQNAIEGSNAIQIDNISAGNGVNGNLQNQADRVGAGNILRRSNLSTQGNTDLEVRSLQPGGGAGRNVNTRPLQGSNSDRPGALGATGFAGGISPFGANGRFGATIRTSGSGGDGFVGGGANIPFRPGVQNLPGRPTAGSLPGVPAAGSLGTPGVTVSPARLPGTIGGSTGGQLPISRIPAGALPGTGGLPASLGRPNIPNISGFGRPLIPSTVGSRTPIAIPVSPISVPVATPAATGRIPAQILPAGALPGATTGGLRTTTPTIDVRRR